MSIFKLVFLALIAVLMAVQITLGLKAIGFFLALMWIEGMVTKSKDKAAQVSAEAADKVAGGVHEMKAKVQDFANAVKAKLHDATAPVTQVPEEPKKT